MGLFWLAENDNSTEYDRFSRYNKKREESILNNQKNKINQMKNEQAKINSRAEMNRQIDIYNKNQNPKEKNSVEKYSNTTGTIVTGSLKVGIGADITGGIVQSKTDSGLYKKCALVSFCPAVGPILQASGGVHGVFSAGEYNTGLSASACATATAAGGVGGAVSNCTIFYDSSSKKKNLGFKNGRELFDSSNQTTAIGGVFGASLGVSGALCPQMTICSTPK